MLGLAEDDGKEGKPSMSRSERRAQRNKMKTDETDKEFQTLESAERQKYEWWGGISKDKDLNGLHHSSESHFF